MTDEKPIENPFPGLRPFEEEEESLFFGREKEVTDLMSQLRSSRFLAVIGTSGSGKSSLIKAGLLPALHRGFMVQAGSHWRVALFRPGDNPIGNLAAVLGNTGDNPDSGDVSNRFREAALRRSNRGLIDVVKQANLPPNRNLLIVVDQFEEIFRFSRLEQAKGDRKRDSAAFIKLLLETRRQAELPIYIILTMRSDFLGDCTVFRGLPEAINDGQYLIPRMTREEKRAAITGPIAVGGGEISTPLLSRLLNDVGENPDQLPILQHALMRTWDYWSRQGRGNEPMDIRHYEAIGTMEQALSQHAEEAFAQLKSEKSRLVCEKLFKLITDTGDTGRGVRRPARVSEICLAADASKKQVIEVIEVFRQPGRTFLMPPHGTVLDDDSVIDISHESFMRIWTRLIDWVKEEGQSAELYTRMATSAALYDEGKVGLWRDPELMLALKWRKENQPNAVWAQRYDPSFHRAIGFLEKSKKQQDLEIAEKEREQRAKIRRARIFAVVISIAAVISIVFGIWAFTEKKAADRARAYAEEQKEIALQNEQEAKKQQKEAEKQREEAIKQQRIAREQKQEADRQKEIAEKNETAAKQAQQQAQKNEQRAIKNEITAKIEGLKVAVNKEKATFRQFRAKAKELAVLSTAQTADKGLKARLAITAYHIHREAAAKLKRETEKILAGFNRDGLDSGQKEEVDRLKKNEYKAIQDRAEMSDVPPELFRALREAFIENNRESGDIVYRGVESWALAVPGGRSLLFNTMDRQLLAVSFPSNNFALPIIHQKDTVPLAGSPLEAVSLLETNNRLFCGTGDGRVICWEKNNWKDMKTLAGHQDKVLALAFSADKNRLFYSVKNIVYMLNPADAGGAKPVIRLNEGIFIRALTVIDSAGGSILITADSGGNIFLSAVEDGGNGIMEKKQLYADPGSGGFYAIARDAGRKLLVLGNSDGEILIFPGIHRGALASGGGKINPVIIEKAHRGIVRVLALSPGGRYLASGGYDGVVKLWDLEGKTGTGIARQEPVLTIPAAPGKGKILSLVFAGNGKAMIFSDSQSLRMCPTHPGSFYKMLNKKGITLLQEDEWTAYIGEAIKKEELIGNDSK